MKHLVGKSQTKKVPFLGDEVEIRKLSIDEVFKMQDMIQAGAEADDQLEVLYGVLRLAVIGAEEMTEDDFRSFPPADLNELSEEILSYCGIGAKAKDSGN
jgi:hypothetical protein